mgnify:CR=1 FL=1
MSGPRLFFALIGISSLLFSTIAYSQTIDTGARHVFLYDMTTDTILLDKESDVPMPPASMSKLMTVYMVLERLKSGSLSLDDKFLVSRKAWRKGGSKMFVMVNKRVSVRDLLRGIIVQSGNDACIVIAEGISGSEEAFAETMTQKGKEIGLRESSFKNSHGYPARGHYMSARDIATLSRRIIRDFPEYYKMFSETEFSFSGIKQGNRNPLLYKGFGADGLKTGYTQASGYGLVASVVRNKRRLLLVVNGFKSIRGRSSESARLLDWGFRETKSYELFKKGDKIKGKKIENADVWLGKTKKITLAYGKDLTLTMSRKARQSLKVKISYKNPIAAPIKMGTSIGIVTVTAPSMDPIQIPILAGQEIQQLGFVGRMFNALKFLLFGKG